MYLVSKVNLAACAVRSRAWFVLPKITGGLLVEKVEMTYLGDEYLDRVPCIQVSRSERLIMSLANKGEEQHELCRMSATERISWRPLNRLDGHTTDCLVTRRICLERCPNDRFNLFRTPVFFQKFGPIFFYCGCEPLVQLHSFVGAMPNIPYISRLGLLWMANLTAIFMKNTENKRSP